MRPDGRSATAKPLDITHPFATCVMGTILRTLTSGVSTHERDGTEQTLSERCAEARASRLVTRQVVASIWVSSDSGTDLTEARPTRRFATKARVPSHDAATANGSRPAAGLLNSRQGDTERTEMSSDIELATRSRAPLGVALNASATGP